MIPPYGVRSCIPIDSPRGLSGTSPLEIIVVVVAVVVVVVVVVYYFFLIDIIVRDLHLPTP